MAAARTYVLGSESDLSDFMDAVDGSNHPQGLESFENYFGEGESETLEPDGFEAGEVFISYGLVSSEGVRLLAVGFPSLRFELEVYEVDYRLKVAFAERLVFEDGQESESHHIAVREDGLEAWWDFIQDHISDNEYEGANKEEELAEIREDFEA